METNQPKQSLINKFMGMSRKKKIFTILGFLSLLSIIYISSLTKKAPEEVEMPASPTPRPAGFVITNIASPEPNTEPKRLNNNEAYLLNRFDSLPGILGYSWIKNKIIYATPNGIYDLWQNRRLVSGPVSRISFSANGKAIYVSNGKYYFADFELNTQTEVDSMGNNFSINDTGNHALHTDGTSLFIYNVSDNRTRSLTVPQISNKIIQWVDTVEYVVIYDKVLKSGEIYDFDLQKTGQFEIGKNEEFSNLNPTLKYAAVKVANNLIVRNITSKNELNYAFDPESELTSHWIDENKIFVLEKRSRGVFDLYDQYFWIIDVSVNSQTYLTNSIVVTNKIDASNKILMNQDQTALLMNENNGKIWTISLVPPQLPTYTENGILFYKVPYITKEDEH